MTDIPKIEKKNPAAVIRDVTEKLPSLRALISVGIHSDGSGSVWASEPSEIERAAIVLLRFAIEALGEAT